MTLQCGCIVPGGREHCALHRSAPKLLAACRSALKWIEYMGGSESGIEDTLRLAIAEADPEGMEAAYSSDLKEGSD